MTTEDDFQAALDANPTDWQTRLVFADWLEERGDPRAEGYRVIGLLKRYPRKEVGAVWSKLGETHWCVFEGHEHLEDDWFDLTTHGASEPVHAIFDNRRAAENAAALAFSHLPAQRRAEIAASGGSP